MSIKEAFDNVSGDYDKHRRQMVPCFDDYYNLPLTVMDFEGDNPTVLDLGAGTGLFSSIVLRKYPKAVITLIDLSDRMIDVAKERFAGHSGIKYVVDDYTRHEFEEKFDIIISALSIHHLTAAQKENLYRKCYELLNDGGVFVNSDIVLSPFPDVEAIFQRTWHQMIGSCGLGHDVVREAIDRSSYDDPSTVEDQLKWLREAGFRYADSLYKYYHFCSLFAKK